MKTRTEKERAIKRVEIAIDKMVALQDSGWGCDVVQRIIDQLNSLRTAIESAQ